MKILLIYLILPLSLLGCASNYSNTSEEWVIKRTIPVPDQVSTVMHKSIVSAGQPDVEANKQNSYLNNQGWHEFTDKVNTHQAIESKRLAERLDVSVTEAKIAGVTVRYVNPPKLASDHLSHIFIHLHSGGYVTSEGFAGVYEAIQLAHYLKMTVISVDYRMPPEHPFPAAVEDVVAVYKELLKRQGSKTIAIGGTSAGGGLSMAVIHKFKQEGLRLPGALFCGTPWTDLTKTGDSYFTNEGIDNTLITYDGMLKAMAVIYAGGTDMKDPLISPVYGDFVGFPPTYLVTGTRDLFLSNTIRAHRKLKTSGAITDLNIYEGASHGVYFALFDSPENRQVYSELGSFLYKHLK